MKKSITILLCTGVLIVVVCCLSVIGADSDADKTEPKVATPQGPERLLMSERQDREAVLHEMTKEYASYRDAMIATVLREAVGKHAKDRSDHSPLHCAIIATRALRIYEAEDFLFLVVDYSIDSSTISAWINVTIEYFYPAATALVALRVDTDKVIEAIQDSDNSRKLACLTWILCERSGTVEQAKLALEKAQKERPDNENLLEAIRLVERSPVKLPPLPK